MIHERAQRPLTQPPRDFEHRQPAPLCATICSSLESLVHRRPQRPSLARSVHLFAPKTSSRGSSSNAHAWPLHGLRRPARPAQVPPPHWGVDREPLPGVLASHAPPPHTIRPVSSLLHAHSVPPRPVPQLQLVRPLARSPQRRGCQPAPSPSPILPLLQPRRRPLDESRAETSAGRRAMPRGASLAAVPIGGVPIGGARGAIGGAWQAVPTGRA